MDRALILLTLPEPVRMQYFNHLRGSSRVEARHVRSHSKVDPYIGSADILITFGAHMATTCSRRDEAKWIQALGTGRGIVDRPALRSGVPVTNMHGLHGDSVPEAGDHADARARARPAARHAQPATRAAGSAIPRAC